jgi:hypothetical protein
MAQAKMIYVIYLQLLGRNIQEALGIRRDYKINTFFFNAVQIQWYVF